MADEREPSAAWAYVWLALFAVGLVLVAVGML